MMKSVAQGKSSASSISWIKMSGHKVPLMRLCRMSNALYSVVNVNIEMPCLIEDVSKHYLGVSVESQIIQCCIQLFLKHLCYFHCQYSRT